MKTMRIIIALISGLLLFAACDDKEANSGDISTKFTIEENSEVPLLVHPADVIIIDLGVTSTTDIGKIQTKFNGILSEGSVKEYSDGAKTQNYSTTYTILNEDVGTTVLIVVEAFDSGDKRGTKEFSVYVQAARANITITLPESAPETIMDNEFLDFEVNVKSDIAIKHIKVYNNEVEITDLEKTDFTNPNEDDFAFTYTPIAGDIDKTLTFVFEVMNTNGGIATTSYQVAVERSAVADFNLFSYINVGAQKNTTTVGPFFNTTTGSVIPIVGSTAVCAGIDLALLYSGSTYGYYLAAPSDISIEHTGIFGSGDDKIQDWPTRNNTQFRDELLNITRTEFDAIQTAAGIKALYDASTATEVVKLTKNNKLVVGSVVVFKTEAGKHAICYVVSHGSGSNIGNVVFDFKVEK